MVDKKPPWRYTLSVVIQARTLGQFYRSKLAEKIIQRGRTLTRVQGWSGAKPVVSETIDQIPGRYHYRITVDRWTRAHLRTFKGQNALV